MQTTGTVSSTHWPALKHYQHNYDFAVASTMLSVSKAYQMQSFLTAALRLWLKTHRQGVLMLCGTVSEL